MSDRPLPVQHEHVYDDRWYPIDRTHTRRVCVLPGCTHADIVEVKL